MKKFVLLFALLASVALGIEATVLGGLNIHSWDDGNGSVGSGSGGHGGILGSIGITPSCLPAYIGVETGFLIQSATYEWATGFGETNLIVKYNNLVIPILAKATLKPSGKFHVGAGFGPSFVIHNSGQWGLGDSGGSIMFDFGDEYLQNDIGLLIKGDVAFKLMPLIWLKPSVGIQLIGSADDPFFTDKDNKAGSETSIFISLGVSIKP
jgi:hypothetical protein